MAFKDDMNLLGKYLQDNQDNQDNPSFNGADGSDGADGADATALVSGNTPVAAQNQVGGTGSVSVSPSTGTPAAVKPASVKPAGSAGTGGTAGTGGVGAGTGATGVPTEEDIRIKGYMKAFSDLIPKTSYADDIKRQEKMQLFNLLANMGKVGMQSIAQTQGVRQFSPIQDESGKIQERIEQFRALQRAADDKRNGTLLSLAIQQRNNDDAARRADAQFQFQRDQAKINQGFKERSLAIQEKEAKENSAHRAWSRKNTEKEQEARNRQWGAEFGLKKQQWEYNTQPVLALSTKFGDLYVKNPEDIEGIVKSYLGRLASEGDQTSAELMARIMESSGSGNTQRAKNAYTSSLEYLNQLLDKNPDALMYIIRSVENEGGELRQSNYQKNAMRHYEYNLQYLYPGDNKPQRPVSTGQSGRSSNQSGGQSGSGGRAGTPNRDEVMNNPFGD